jgi:hypothetical protein
MATNTNNIVETKYYIAVVESVASAALPVGQTEGREFYLVVHHEALQKLVDMIATLSGGSVMGEPLREAVVAKLLENAGKDYPTAKQSNEGDVLVYDPKNIFNQIVDENGQKKSLDQLIQSLVEHKDMFKFLMELGKMAG